MPTDSGGNYTLPPGYQATSGNIILASQHNPPLEDLAQAMTGRLPRNGSAGMLANLNMGGFRITNVGSGTASTDLITRSQLLRANPPGKIIPWPGVSAPSGWYMCNGQAILRTAAPDLATNLYVGDSLNATANFGYRTTSQGDPSNNRSTSGQYIVLPDVRGRTIFGKSNMGGVDIELLTGLDGGIDGTVLFDVGGIEAVELTAAQNGPHGHTGTTSQDGDHSHTVTGPSNPSNAEGGSGTITTSNTSRTTSVDGAHTHDLDIAESGDGEAHNNLPPGIVMNFIIFAGL